MRFKSLGLGRREKDANSQTDIRQVSSHLCCSTSVCHKTIQYYSKTIFAEKKCNIDTNICLHGHLHNYYQKVVIQATVISAHLATFEARGYRTEAIKLVNICSRTNTK